MRGLMFVINFMLSIVGGVVLLGMFSAPVEQVSKGESLVALAIWIYIVLNAKALSSKRD